MVGALLQSYNSIEEIESVIPHRGPAILIDRVYSYSNCAIGYKYFSETDSKFDGHFYDEPILPGIYLIEGMAQTAAFCVIEGFDPKCKMLAINKVKFYKSVLPSTLVEYYVEVTNLGLFSCVAKVGSDIVASMELLAV